MTAISNDDYVDILGPDTTKFGPVAKRSGVSGKREAPAVIARPYALLKAIPDGGTYLGVALIVVGFVLIAICWGKVAGLTAIGLQMPYLASAGLPGLGLIVTGIAIVGAASREKDASLRRAQMSELASTLRQLRGLLGELDAGAVPAVINVPGASELTTEMAVILDLPMDDGDVDDGDVLEVQRPVRVTGRATKPGGRPVAATRPTAKAAARPTKTVKRVSR